MKWMIFFLLLSFQANGESNCQQFLSDCEYYSCIEESKRCGKRGYPLGFGKKYCNRFAGLSHQLSDQGKRWMETVRNCLIEKLETVSPEATCRKFKREAISQHVPCYVESGYCELSKKDKKIVLKTIRKSLWRPTLFVAGIRVIRLCKRSVKGH